MRTLGIVLMILAGMLIVSGAIDLAKRKGSIAADGLSESQQRMDVFVPAALVAVIGFALAMLSKRAAIITATPVDQWLSIEVTSAASNHAKRLIAEGRYPPGTGLRIIAGDTAGVFESKYDIADDGGGDCIGEDNGA